MTPALGLGECLYRHLDAIAALASAPRMDGACADISRSSKTASPARAGNGR